MVLQLAAGRVECIADGDVSILMPPRRPRVAANIDMLAAEHCQVDAIALVVAMLRAGNYQAR